MTSGYVGPRGWTSPFQNFLFWIALIGLFIPGPGTIVFFVCIVWSVWLSVRRMQIAQKERLEQAARADAEWRKKR